MNIYIKRYHTFMYMSIQTHITSMTIKRVMKEIQSATATSMSTCLYHTVIPIYPICIIGMIIVKVVV